MGADVCETHRYQFADGRKVKLEAEKVFWSENLWQLTEVSVTVNEYMQLVEDGYDEGSGESIYRRVPRKSVNKKETSHGSLPGPEIQREMQAFEAYMKSAGVEMCERADERTHFSNADLNTRINRLSARPVKNTL